MKITLTKVSKGYLLSSDNVNIFGASNMHLINTFCNQHGYVYDKAKQDKWLKSLSYTL